MPSKIPPQIIERYNSLAQELKEALFSDATSDIISRVCNFYHLSDEKADLLTLLIGDVLMGFVHYNDFSKVLAEKMAGNTVVAQSIAKEIDKELFFSLRKFLREVYKPISKEALLAQEVKMEKEAEMPSFVPEPALAAAPAKLAAEPVASKTPALSEKQEAQPELVKRKSFLPFFKFKKSESATSDFGSGAPIIIGKQTEVKPTLEAPTPFVISFEEVNPQKEKIVSNMEVEMDKKPGETKSMPIVKTIPEMKSASQPVRIVNFSAPTVEAAKPKESFFNLKEQASTAKSDVSAPPEVKKEAPPLIQFSSFPANKVNFPSAAAPSKPVINPITPVVSEKPKQTTPTTPFVPTSQEKPSIIIPPTTSTPASDKKEEKPNAPVVSEKMPEVPPENVVDLRQFKF